MRTEAITAFWQTRSARERSVLTWGALVVLVLTGYGGLWRPMTADLARIEEQLPRLRAQSAQIKQAGDEITRLRAVAPAGAVDRTQLPALLTRSAGAHQLQGLTLAAGQGGVRVKASFERVAFSAWLGWVDELHRSHRIMLVESRISALDTPGSIRAEAEFALAAEPR